MKSFIQLKTKSARGNDQGFTLIEVLFALLIFTVGIMAVATMSYSAFNNFSQAGVSTVEVNRAVTNIDTLKMVSTLNDQVFQNGQSQTTFPFNGSLDQAFVTCWDFNDVVVRGTTFVAVENNQIRGGWARGDPGNPNENYRLYYTIGSRTVVN